MNKYIVECSSKIENRFHTDSEFFCEAYFGHGRYALHWLAAVTLFAVVLHEYLWDDPDLSPQHIWFAVAHDFITHFVKEVEPHTYSPE